MRAHPFLHIALTFQLLLPIATAGSAWSKDSQIQVKLFEQPCVLSGPFEEDTLKLIHSMSPERMPLPESQEQAKKSLETAKAISGAPAQLDRYREQLVRRMEAQKAFLDALTAAKKKKNAAELFTAAKPFQTPAKAKAFQTEFNKLTKDKKWAFGTDDATALFNDSTDPLPEEEFHRAIQKLGIRYGCSFEAEHAESSD